MITKFIMAILLSVFVATNSFAATPACINGLDFLMSLSESKGEVKQIINNGYGGKIDRQNKKYLEKEIPEIKAMLLANCFIN